MRRLLSVLGLFWCGLACASLPRDSFARLDYFAPATNVTVNGQPAQTYGDFTFAATNLSLANGANTFTMVAQNAYGLRATNTQICNLPSSVPLAWDFNGNLTNDGARSFAYNTPKSGRGQPHSKTLPRFSTRGSFRKVLECGCLLPLSYHLSLPASTGSPRSRPARVGAFSRVSRSQ